MQQKYMKQTARGAVFRNIPKHDSQHGFSSQYNNSTTSRANLSYDLEEDRIDFDSDGSKQSGNNNCSQNQGNLNKLNSVKHANDRPSNVNSKHSLI